MIISRKKFEAITFGCINEFGDSNGPLFFNRRRIYTVEQVFERNDKAWRKPLKTRLGREKGMSSRRGRSDNNVITTDNSKVKKSK